MSDDTIRLRPVARQVTWDEAQNELDRQAAMQDINQRRLAGTMRPDDWAAMARLFREARENIERSFEVATGQTWDDVFKTLTPEQIFELAKTSAEGIAVPPANGANSKLLRVEPGGKRRRG